MKLWKVIWQRFLKALPKMFVDQSAIEPDPAPAVEGQPQTLWPYIECNWMIHGEGLNENEVRAAAIREAAATGKAIKFKFHDSGTDLRFWLFWWESDVDKGKFPNPEMGTPKALAAGVRKWIANIAGVDLQLVRDTFKAYGDPDHMIQFTGIPITKDVMRILECDANGIKTSKPRMR